MLTIARIFIASPFLLMTALCDILSLKWLGRKFAAVGGWILGS